MINDIRFGPEKAMLHDLQRLSRDTIDLNFRGQNGETPVSETWNQHSKILRMANI